MIVFYDTQHDTSFKDFDFLTEPTINIYVYVRKGMYPNVVWKNNIFNKSLKSYDQLKNSHSDTYSFISNHI